MTLRRIRLTLRLHRFEVFAFGVSLIVLSIAAFIAATYIDSLKPGAECYSNTGDVSAACQHAFDAYNAAQGSLGALLGAPTLIVTSVIGLFLGVPIVGREIERGTTRLAWSLGSSRWRWYLSRVLPMAVVVVVASFIAGVAMDRYFAASTPNQDLTQSFAGYGSRGGLLAARALFLFGVSVVAGALIGRALPAVIVAGLLCGVALAAGENFYQSVLLRQEAVPVAMADYSYQGNQPLFFDMRWQLADGTLVGYEYFGNQGPPYDNDTGQPVYPEFQLVVPGTQYRWVEAREAAALVGGSIIAIIFGGFVVQHRRPQ